MNITKVVLAYSGGLDTSIILRWLQETYNCEVVTFTADKGEEVEPARAKALAMGIPDSAIFIGLQRICYGFVFPMFRATVIGEGNISLELHRSTLIARDLLKCPRDKCRCH